MSNTVAILIRNTPENMSFGSELNIGGHDVKVSAVAFYDIFQNNEKLEDFVRNLASGGIDNPIESAIAIMDALNFA